jgi:hAT family C-terminal dimerisation region
MVKIKVPKYFVLTRLTRDILVVPISIVASKSTFSTSGRTLNPVSNSLSDETIEARLLLLIYLTCYYGLQLKTLLLFFIVAENNGDFDNILWPSDEATSNDGVCDCEA